MLRCSKTETFQHPKIQQTAINSIQDKYLNQQVNTPDFVCVLFTIMMRISTLFECITSITSCFKLQVI